MGAIEIIFAMQKHRILEEEKAKFNLYLLFHGVRFFFLGGGGQVFFFSFIFSFFF